MRASLLRGPLTGLLLAAWAVSVSGETAPVAPPPGPPVRYAAWLAEVAVLISDAERQTFLSLGKDFQREEFIRRFWQARDPYPQTARNELLEAWKERVDAARERFGGLEEERARMLLALGPPATSVRASCSEVLRPLEIWTYSRGRDSRDSFTLVFVAPTGSPGGPFALWHPGHGLAPLLSLTAQSLLGPAGADPLSPGGTDRGGAPLASGRASELGGSGLGALGGGGEPARVSTAIAEHCSRGDDILSGLASAVDGRLPAGGAIETARALLPRPNDEWLRTFVAFSTDLPAGARTFDAELAVSFPGRQQSRTVVQGLISVPAPAVEAGAGRPFVLDGEVLRGQELFEHFRYRFQMGPSDAVAGRWPLLFQRLLRPGEYTLIVKVEEPGESRFFRVEQALSVPAEPTPIAVAGVTAGAEPVLPGAPPADQALAERQGALAAGDTAIELLAPPARLLTGRHRFEALAVGAAVARVRFELDGKPVLTKREPPWSAEVDLGPAPRIRRLRAVALDAEARELTADELVVNAGPHRFAVRLLEPRPGERYTASVPAAAVVEVPEGEILERLEVYRGETLVATLYQPPFSQPILLPAGEETSYVRAVAYLADGSSTEDAVLINSPQFGESLKVRFVELYTAVVDRRGRPVEDLARGDFRVFENGAEQTVLRFERVRDQPIHAGVLLDTSASMLEELADAEAGALEFFGSVLTARDRAAVITFNDGPRLAVRFTNDPEVLAGGLAGLTAEGETALYDSLIYGLYYFSGLSGKRALILLSDGEDSTSRYRFEDVVEYARRTGVAIYPIGIGLASRQNEFRLKLSRLAKETGGLAFFTDGGSGIGRAYQAIAAELRSQYLLAYQSASGEGDEAFREVEVKMRQPALDAKTILGYYP